MMTISSKQSCNDAPENTFSMVRAIRYAKRDFLAILIVNIIFYIYTEWENINSGSVSIWHIVTRYALDAVIILLCVIDFVKHLLSKSYRSALIYAGATILLFIHLLSSKIPVLDMRIKSKLIASIPQLCMDKLPKDRPAFICYQYEIYVTDSERERALLIYNPSDELSLPAEQWSDEIYSLIEQNAFCPVIAVRRIAEHIYYARLDAVIPRVKVNKTKYHVPPLLGTMAGIKLLFPYHQVGHCSIGYNAIVYYADQSRDWILSHSKDPHDPPGTAMWTWDRLIRDANHPGQSTHFFKTFEPKQDSPITDFYIEVRMDNFKPARSRMDLMNAACYYSSSYDIDRHLPKQRRWSTVRFKPALFAEYGENLKSLFEKLRDNKIKEYGQFIASNSLYNLKHINTIPMPVPYPKNATKLASFYFNDQNWSTFIECDQDNRDLKTMHCDHYFAVPVLKSIAIASYYINDDLARWQDLETGIRKQVLSYIVDKDSPKP